MGANPDSEDNKGITTRNSVYARNHKKISELLGVEPIND